MIIIFIENKILIFFFLTIFVEENSLSITREIREEDLMYSIVSYASENEDTLNLVEGEKVYVVGKFKTMIINIQ